MLTAQLLTADDLTPLHELLRQLLEAQQAAARPADDYLSVEQVAIATDTSVRTVRKWLAEGKPGKGGNIIKLFKLEFSPGYPRIPRSALVMFGQGLAFDASMLPLPAAGAPPVPKKASVLDSKQALRRAG